MTLVSLCLTKVPTTLYHVIYTISTRSHYRSTWSTGYDSARFKHHVCPSFRYKIIKMTWSSIDTPSPKASMVFSSTTNSAATLNFNSALLRVNLEVKTRTRFKGCKVIISLGFQWACANYVTMIFTMSNR